MVMRISMNLLNKGMNLSYYKILLILESYTTPASVNDTSS